MTAVAGATPHGRLQHPQDVGDLVGHQRVDIPPASLLEPATRDSGEIPRREGDDLHRWLEVASDTTEAYHKLFD